MEQGLAEERAGSESGASKALFGAVIVMGVLIVLGVAVMIGVIVYRVAHPRPLGAPAVGGVSPARGARLALPLGTGEHVVSVTARADGMMAVTLEGGQGVRVLLWSPEQGRIVSELDFGGVSAVTP